MVAILGGYMVIRGAIQVGDIQSFFQYIRSFMQPITQVAQVTNMLQSSAAAAERVFEFLEEPGEENTAKIGMDAVGLRGNVQFDHVRFGYDPEKVIMIGDAPGDCDAAEKNGVYYYPILVNHEKES